MEKLVEVTRGSLVESEHRGSIVVADAEGNLLARAGNPDLVTYYRSSAKPIQAIPVITTGAARKFALTEAELAIICACFIIAINFYQVTIKVTTKAVYALREVGFFPISDW